MRIHIGTDHAAFETKNAIVAALEQAGYEVVDHGAHRLDPEDDYPRFIIPAAQAVAAEAGSLGLVLGGSGNGEVIAANKVPGVRAALIHSLETARLARQHNDAQVASIGARMHSSEECVALALAFLETEFSGQARHQRRIDQLSRYESSGRLDD
ncbi:MAG: ribose-5-phosphate isomerase [Propionibacteriaceae bacterium]|jgi:ribose 5-phosphate isomerase B|nr:ribose-5-phosphate isomerase [Propionibacteriaceae bacterium]